DGASDGVTRYDYDGAGRLARVVDGDGNQVTLSHDGEGHRTSIVRPGGRTWTYRFHPNGELYRREDGDPLSPRITEYSYDAAGRVVLEQVIDARLPPGRTPAELGIGRMAYYYDGAGAGSGANRMGRLDSVRIYRQGASQPYASYAFGYDPQGNVINEGW